MEAGRAATGPAASSRLALFPFVNLSGTAVPGKEIQASLERTLRAQGLDVVAGRVLEGFLARHRIRWVGGLDREAARAARAELGVDGVLLTSLELYNTLGAPRHAMTMRLVSVADTPAILWMDGTARAGDDSPGLFGVGLVGSMKELEDRALSRLTGSLLSFLRGKGPRIGTCPGGARWAPRIRYRSPRLERPEKLSVAVLPFVNQTSRSGAGEVIALSFVRQLASAKGIDVLEPGIVRSELLRHRVILEGGVSHEAARVAAGSMDVDLVLSGYVRTYEDLPVPKVELTVIALDTRTNATTWYSTSYNRGDDGVFFFDAGRVATSSALSCRMVRTVVDEMMGHMGYNTEPHA